VFDLSFCIPTLNRASELRESLSSIVEQADEARLPIEVVIVDGGSTDGTAEMVDSFAASDFATIRRIPSATKSGVDRDILQSVECATGRWCWLFSDDDRLAPGALRHVHGLLVSTPSVVGMSTNYQAFDAQLAYPIATVPAIGGGRSTGTALSFTSREDCFAALALHLGFISCQIVDRSRWLHAQHLEDVSPFCNAWIIVYMIGRMLEQPCQWLYVPEKCVHYRSGNDSFIARLGTLRRQQITHVAFADILRRFFRQDSPTYRAVMTHLVRDRMPRTLAVLKARGMPLGLQLSLAQMYVRCYWTYRSLWWRVLPLFAVPSAAFRLVWKLYRQRQAKALGGSAST
jgi:abequosyltransferase